MRINCPQCQKSLNVPSEAAGRSGKCSECGSRFVVPKPATKKVDAIVPAIIEPIQPHPAADLIPSPEAPTALPQVNVAVAPPMVNVGVSVRPQQTNSMGKTSVILGVLGLLSCWIPLVGLIGLPLSLLGALLGVIGLFLGITRSGSGVGFAIGGIAISSTAIAVASVINGAILLPAFQQAQEAVKRTKEKNLAKQGIPVAPAQAKAATPEPEKWLNGKNLIVINDLRIKITSATVGKLTLKTSFREKEYESDEIYLIVKLNITNSSNTKKVTYRTWSGSDFSVHRDYASAEDVFGNIYRRQGFGSSTNPVGAVETSESIYPGKTIGDVLVFEPLIDAAESIRLELPGENIGDDRMIRIEIPQEMITRTK